MFVSSRNILGWPLFFYLRAPTKPGLAPGAYVWTRDGSEWLGITTPAATRPCPRPRTGASIDRSYDAALLACAAGGQGKRATSLLEEVASLEAQQQPVAQQGGDGDAGDTSAVSSVRQADRPSVGPVFFPMFIFCPRDTE